MNGFTYSCRVPSARRERCTTSLCSLRNRCASCMCLPCPPHCVCSTLQHTSAKQVIIPAHHAMLHRGAVCTCRERQEKDKRKTRERQEKDTISGRFDPLPPVFKRHDQSRFKCRKMANCYAIRSKKRCRRVRTFRTASGAPSSAPPPRHPLLQKKRVLVIGQQSTRVPVNDAEVTQLSFAGSSP